MSRACGVRAKSRLLIRLLSASAHPSWFHCFLWLGCRGRTFELGEGACRRNWQFLNCPTKSMYAGVLVCRLPKMSWSLQAVGRSTDMSFLPWFSIIFSSPVWSDSSSSEQATGRILTLSRILSFHVRTDRVVAISECHILSPISTYVFEVWIVVLPLNKRGCIFRTHKSFLAFIIVHFVFG